ncbi:hypothetical protein SESBI_36355 [Sesbania bispinosa]|nr:hypothetical protein SESBI_36355 [Sesbania bispinosa]
MNGELVKLQKNPWNEFQRILDQEELFWVHKSHCDWVKFGDRNTRLYHTIVVVRLKKNKVEALQNEDGVLVSDMASLKNMIVDFFKHMYCEEGRPSTWPLVGKFPGPTASKLTDLHLPFMEEEVKSAIFSMGPLKL